MKRMASGPPRHKMNDILWQICCLIAPPIYSFIHKGYKKEGCRVALIFLLLEVISFTLDLLGGSRWSYLLASFLLSILIVSITFYVYFIERANIRALNKSEAEQLFVVEIVYSCLQLVISGFCLIRTLCGVNTNYSASAFPLAYSIVAVGFSFKNSKDDSDFSSHTSSNTPSDHLDVDLDELELSSVRVDPTNIPSQFSEIEVIPSETTPNKDYVPTSSNANEIQRETRTSTLQKRKNESLQSDQGLQNEVNEEVDRGLAHRSFRSITRSPSLRIQALEPSGFKLIFSKKISLPIFTGSKITDVENSPLQILLVDTRDGHMAPASLPHPIKVDIVVLDGDFPPGDRDNWTSKEFDSNIIKARTGKHPLLTGEVNITLRDGFATTGDFEFTDNSSWIRGQKFRIGAKVVSGNTSGVRIQEAITEAFDVKDHRVELYKKHYPPMLEDEVWRLEKIGKDGAFHRKLSSSGINTVQEFLKLSTVDPQKLRTILGVGMSEKMWEVTIKHARKCVMGNKLYLFRGPDFTIILNPICQVVRALINGHIYSTRDLPTINRTYIEKLVREAYSNWYSLEEVEGLPNEPDLLTQGDMVDQYPNHHHQSMAMKSIQQSGFPVDHKSAEVGCSDWQIDSNAYLSTISIEHGTGGYSISESSSDGELTASRSFIDDN